MLSSNHTEMQPCAVEPSLRLSLKPSSISPSPAGDEVQTRARRPVAQNAFFHQGQEVHQSADHEGYKVKEVTASYNPQEIEAGVQDRWRRENIYPRVQEMRKDGDAFFFVDGPPYTTGNIHLGTAWNKIIKDAILRYHRMLGRKIIERAGYDMHGLPIEVKVEHQLGFTSKKDIEDYGIAQFIEQCRTFAVTHMEVMSEQFRRLGVWLDFDDPYQTIKEEYIESAWWTIQRAEERGPGRELVPPLRDGDRRFRGRILGRDRSLHLCQVPHHRAR
jgi:hypothetical protein